MKQLSIPSILFFILGVILIILAGFNTPNVPLDNPSISFFFLAVGIVFVLIAVLMALRENQKGVP